MMVLRDWCGTDLQSKILDDCPQIQFVHFSAVFSELWPNNRLATSFVVGAPRFTSFGVYL